MKRVRLIIAEKRAAKDVKQAVETCEQGGVGHASFGSLAPVVLMWETVGILALRVMWGDNERLAVGSIVFLNGDHGNWPSLPSRTCWSRTMSEHHLCAVYPMSALVCMKNRILPVEAF
jgi:hypothetical protein